MEILWINISYYRISKGHCIQHLGKIEKITTFPISKEFFLSRYEKELNLFTQLLLLDEETVKIELQALYSFYSISIFYNYEQLSSIEIDIQQLNEGTTAIEQGSFLWVKLFIDLEITDQDFYYIYLIILIRQAFGYIIGNEANWFYRGLYYEDFQYEDYHLSKKINEFIDYLQSYSFFQES